MYTVDIKEIKKSFSMTVEEKVAACNKRRTQGNTYFKAGDLDNAMLKYGNAFKIVQYLEEEDPEKKVPCLLHNTRLPPRTRTHSHPRIAQGPS